MFIDDDDDDDDDDYDDYDDYDDHDDYDDYDDHDDGDDQDDYNDNDYFNSPRLRGARVRIEAGQKELPVVEVFPWRLLQVFHHNLPFGPITYWV